jgi:hypothetical protein
MNNRMNALMFKLTNIVVTAAAIAAVVTLLTGTSVRLDALTLQTFLDLIISA